MFFLLTVVFSDSFTDDSKRFLIRNTDILHFNNLVSVYLKLFLKLIDDSFIDIIFLSLSGNFSSENLIDLVFPVSLSQLRTKCSAFIADLVALLNDVVNFEF